MVKEIPESMLNYFRYEDGEVLVIQPYGKRKVGDNAARLNKGLGRYVVNYLNKQYLRYRVIWFLYYKTQPPEMIDHKDRDKRNDLITNLRETTQKDNSLNCDWVDKAKGTIFNTQSGKYRARANRQGKRLYFGEYGTEAEARSAYLKGVEDAK